MALESAPASLMPVPVVPVPVTSQAMTLIRVPVQEIPIAAAFPSVERTAQSWITDPFPATIKPVR